MPKIADFGCAALATRDVRTGLGPFVGRPRGGTTQYAAPERCDGTGATYEIKPGPAATAVPVTTAVDVYSFGLIMTDVLSGRNDVRPARAFDSPPDIPTDLPADSEFTPALQDLVRRCCSQEAAGRPDSAEIADTLRRMMST